MKPETKVGLLFLLSLVLIAGFAWTIGALNPFSNANDLHLGYNFAGGIEVGSPVRVMGIKVGKVKSILFDPNQKAPNGEEVKLRITISVSKDAWATLRADSKFFINLAGVIGEKFIEATPGSISADEFKPGDFVRGEDPPRIDQLISQGYGLAGKILELVQRNERPVTDTLNQINSLVTNVNRTLVLLEKLSKNQEVGKVIGNVSIITEDLTHLTGRLRGDEAQKTLDLLHRLIWRLDKVDEKAIREFFQKEGIRARLF